MHDDIRNLHLEFPTFHLGMKETPPNLRRLLYKGGASFRLHQADKAIKDGLLGGVLPERVDLVCRIHEFIEGLLIGGGSPVTARRQIEKIVSFFEWADKSGAALGITEVVKVYLDWAEYLVHRVRVVKDLGAGVAYHYARLVGQVLDGALGRVTPMIELTRLRWPSRKKSPQSTKVDKQILHGTFAFGRLLQDICDGLHLEVILEARPPVCIHLQDGGEIEIGLSGLAPLPDEKRDASSVRASAAAALKYETDRSLDVPRRRTLVNLRITAEMLMFIGQTSMNLEQAKRLPLRHFSYSSDIDGYKVKEYKSRRHGEVLFEIFSEYRNQFERYLDWRRQLFPDSEQRLFPLIKCRGARETGAPEFSSIKNACKKAGVPWTPPSLLRGTRVNWLLRRSGDPDLTADMAQHHKRTLLDVYEKPSMQRAVIEITRFHMRHDPALSGKELSLAVAPGECDGTPTPSPSKPEAAPEPDCTRPSGCLWCEHHRDIDSLDYVWSLACFRHLKILELSRDRSPTKAQGPTHPAEHVIQRLSEKLTWFRESNITRREWVEESLARIEEGDYHDQWSYIIEAMEGVAN